MSLNSNQLAARSDLIALEDALVALLATAQGVSASMNSKGLPLHKANVDTIVAALPAMIDLIHRDQSFDYEFGNA